MISEERVKELYHLAAFDEYENKKYYQAGEYTMWDYVCKKLSQDESIWKSSEESAQITAGRKIKDGA